MDWLDGCEWHLAQLQEAHVRILCGAQEEQRAPRTAHTRSTAHAMHKGIRVLRRVELHNPVNVRDVEAPRRHVGA